MWNESRRRDFDLHGHRPAGSNRTEAIEREQSNGVNPLIAAEGHRADAPRSVACQFHPSFGYRGMWRRDVQVLRSVHGATTSTAIPRCPISHH